MKQNDDVFFFTLIDFLVQVLFFGLFLFVALQTIRDKAEEKQNADSANIKRMEDWAGVSNLTQLSDLLTKLAPPSELHSLGEIARAAGGKEALAKKIEKLRKIEEGVDKPSCLVTSEGHTAILATVIADDNTLRFEAPTPELNTVLSTLGTNFNAIRELPLATFAEIFAPLTQIRPDCRYTVRLIENTRFVDARDALGGVFYFRKSR